ncbi:MAG: large conductance mechanosensitive channel protein MscL, partial [Sphaerochaetaceae bacterium]
MVKKSAFLEEFKKFISRGNVIDLAVGVIVGNAFSAIVKSLVNDIVMPFIGLISGGVNFTSLEVVLRKPIEGREPLVLAYGSFIQAVIDFLLIALVVFV